MAAPVPVFTFNNGVKVPSIGLGCWMGYPGGGEAVEEMCKTALQTGYRHLDTASGYHNEEHVGRAVRESGIPREEIFVVTKLPPWGHGKVQEHFDASLKALGLDYIDLYLMHWPQEIELEPAPWTGKATPHGENPKFIQTWKDMEKLLETGKVKSIGVSNFSIKTLKELLPHCTVVPVTNQVELHPCLPSSDLKAFCEERGIILTAYSPLGQGQTVFFTDPDIKRIAEKHDATPAQVVISWGVQRRTIIIPKSANPERLKQNITLVQLSDEDMKTLDELHKKPGMHRSLLEYHTEEGTVYGWTYEELGWSMGKGGVVVE
ncbi:Aldo/keto reductase [Obba rivulosa]|uniref:Aldo/keto reductase n=1 Tax=Obba rivulosa TaxID=1052685 RepID=A0A8E2DLX6_9APHY|nr:Aldo/keto reductase [Obba rivulosa]